MVKLCVVEMDFCTRMLRGRSRNRKNVKPEMPMENATGMPSSRNTKKMAIAAIMPFHPTFQQAF